MSTPVTTSGDLRDAPNFCRSCGTPLAGGRFCPECGAPLGAGEDEVLAPDNVAEFEAQADDTTDDLTDPLTYDEPIDDARTDTHSGSGRERPTATPDPVTHAQAPPALAVAPQSRGAKPGLIIGVLVGLLIMGAVAAALLLGGKDRDTGNAGTAYRQKIASAMGPVLGANRQASDVLAHLRGKKVKSAGASDARIAVTRAQRAVTLATGAVGALNIPAGSEQLARDTRQVLDREHAYYAGVSRVLNRPAHATTGGLQESASDLTSALSVAGPTVAGTEPTVSGTTRLVNWATEIRRAAAKRAKKASGRTTSRPSNGSSPRPTSPTPAPASSGTSCGDGVFAGPNTSCAFAMNVRAAWDDAPGTTNTVRVHSPVTGQTYTMNCAPSGRAITCSGANSASVTF
jgi:hypothetical protein